MEPVYVTREELGRGLDVKPSAYMAAELDRACRSGSRAAEGLLHRIFYPETLTRRFDYPLPGGSPVNKIFFDERSLVSLTSASSDGVTIPTNAVLLRPNAGPPYEWVELDQDLSYSFSGGPQNAVTLAGLWGYTNDETLSGSLSGAINSSTANVTLTVPADVGVILRVDSERMIVTGKTWSTTGQTATLAADKTSTSLAVANGTLFTEGESLLIDSERLEVLEIVSNTLIVRRAAGGTALAAHTAATVYWQHTMIVQRGSLGTTAAAHLDAASVYRWECPSLVKELSQAYAEDAFLQRNAGYARTTGSGENEKQVSVSGIRAVESRAYAQYGRKVRMIAV